MGRFDNIRFSDEFKNQTITISALEMGQIIVREMSRICKPEDIDENTTPEKAMAVLALFEILKDFGAGILSEMYDVEGGLRIEPKEDK